MLLRLTNVSKRYRERLVTNGVSLDVRSGEAIALVGPSGCGKTTLLRLIAGLEIPDEGDIEIDGRRVAAAGRNLVPPHRRGIGFVFQDLALWPHLTIEEHLRFVLTSCGVPREEGPKRIADTLRLTRIDALAERYPHELSGGEQQRAALARSVVTRPPLLLLDEPLSSLDSELRLALREELIALRRALAPTMVYVTHDRDEANAIADRVLSMRNGRTE